jgi:hypothetical protein
MIFIRYLILLISNPFSRRRRKLGARALVPWVFPFLFGGTFLDDDE